MTNFRELLSRFDVGKGASPDEIAAAERALGIRLPDGYKEFVSQVGWAGIEATEIYGLGADAGTWLELVSITLGERRMEAPLPTHLLPLANDGMGNLECLDLSRDPAPVVFRDHDRPDDKPEEIAPTFSRWVLDVIAREGDG